MDIDKWPGYSILCRNTSFDMDMAGGFYSNEQYQNVFRVDKCVNETENDEKGRCASPEEINKFISNVKIETWTANFKLDFNIHEGIPLRNNVRWLRSDVLDPEIVKQNWIITRQHVVNTEDAYI